MKSQGLPLTEEVTNKNLLLRGPLSEAMLVENKTYPLVDSWMLLKIKQEGQTAGFGTHVSTYRSGKPFWNTGF